MVVHAYGHDLLGVLLSDYIFVQAGFDLMRRRDPFDVQDRFGLFFLLFLFLLYLLLVPENPLQIRHVNKADVRTLSGRRLEEIADVDAVHAREDVHLTHAVKNLLHTVLADVHVAGKMGQPAALALRAPAHGAVFFKTVVIFVLVRSRITDRAGILLPQVCGICFCFSEIVIICHKNDPFFV